MENNKLKLSQEKGSIANCLMSNKEKIDTDFENEAVSLAQYKTDLKNLVIAINDKPLEKKSAATKRFLLSVDRAKSKFAVCRLVWNTILAGDGNAVVKF